jgi:hypothetical protein
MPAKKTLMIVAVTAIVVLLIAPRLRALPGVSKLPTF